ncbi:MAG TPA: cytochrome c [Solirubrobacteraceae bacterium]|nr:cytochrome c [Solirubrobacteraceae bacterium]
MRTWGTALLVAASALAGCGSSAQRPPATAQRALRAEGRALFLDAHCGDCHALAAAGTRGGDGPDLDTSERLDRAQIAAALLAGANGMPSYAQLLSARQRRAVTEFLYEVTHAQR